MVFNHIALERDDNLDPENIAFMRFLRMKRWSPYAAGALIGVLSWFSFVSADRPLGASTAIARTAGMAEKVVAGDHVSKNAYFARFPPVVDWEWMLVLGVAAGAFVSSRLSRDMPFRGVAQLWRERFGASRVKRYSAAFVGGAVMMFGARMAGGCTSGHGISGSLQLAVSGWVFFACIFISGSLTALALYGRGRTRA
jgi:uncharacterized membrane protein YedE/YeeE